MPLNPTRKPDQPFPTAPVQDWVGNMIEAQHQEALYAFGELVYFTMMWRSFDFEAGLVGRCPTCFLGVSSRQAAAFQQAANSDCADCYGTTFEGGIRAQIIRPALFAERNSEIVDESRGLVIPETLAIETTGDFTLHQGDYVFRYDDSRYQAEEKDETVPRTGFAPPLASDSVSGPVTIHREDSTSKAYLIPPDTRTLLRHLGIPGPFLVSDLTTLDQVRPNGYLL